MFALLREFGETLPQCKRSTLLGVHFCIARSTVTIRLQNKYVFTAFLFSGKAGLDVVTASHLCSGRTDDKWRRATRRNAAFAANGGDLNPSKIKVYMIARTENSEKHSLSVLSFTYPVAITCCRRRRPQQHTGETKFFFFPRGSPTASVVTDSLSLMMAAPA